MNKNKIDPYQGNNLKKQTISLQLINPKINIDLLIHNTMDTANL